MNEEDEEGYSSMMNPYYYDDGMGGRSGGRGSNARRDSMGRYSSEGGYSGADEAMDDVLSDMREIMQDMPQEKKMEMQRFIQKMEQMQLNSIKLELLKSGSFLFAKIF